MAGSAIRSWEIARHLARSGHPVRLIAPRPHDDGGDALELPAGVVLHEFQPGALGRQLHGCAAAVGQGQRVNDLLLEVPELPVVVDFYDPWLIENLHYVPSLGLDPYRNDHATWMLQLSRGDLFLCSSAQQRLYLLGLLTALGRINPESMEADPAFGHLVRVVPFGLPEETPAYQPLLPERQGDEKRLLFGGLYDWYDPLPALRAVAEGDPSWRLLLIRNPNPATPQQRFAEVESWARARSLWGTRIVALDWVPYERRYDLLRDVDLLVSTHRPSLETDLSLRTRFLDAMLAGCPIVVSAGGAISDLLHERDAAWVVPAGTDSGLRDALARALGGSGVQEAAEHRERLSRARQAAEEFAWRRTLQPLLDYCAQPRRDASKERFSHIPSTVAPRDGFGFRLRRRLRLLFGGAPQ
jgi:hypothetical protein